MILVLLESPFAGNVERNIAYARACLRDSLLRGEAPLASHLLYTQEGVLDDNEPDERTLGIEAGLAWGKRADMTAVYTDLGVSNGMLEGIARAKAEGRRIEYRRLHAESPEYVPDDRKCRRCGAYTTTVYCSRQCAGLYQ